MTHCPAPGENIPSGATATAPERAAIGAVRYAFLVQMYVMYILAGIPVALRLYYKNTYVKQRNVPSY